ncbi:MAG TPA: discoidin domain-containing protein, partial [Polyangia bacterium]|nr:discoidin domain-containing protein [Polyangia bacterium]
MARQNLARFLGLCALAATAIVSAPARAQTCDTQNLLAGKRPAQWQDLKGDAALVTDGAIGAEGTQWDAPVGVQFDTGAGSLTYDLGQPTPVAGVYLQADANDTYKIMGSLDGTPGSWKMLVEIDNASDRGHGLRGRSMQFPPVTVRFIRAGEGSGDGFYSISEFAAYCQPPYPFPPSMKVVDAPQAAVNTAPWYKFEWWDDKPSARFEMCLAFFAFLVLYWGWRVARAGKETKLPPWAETGIMAVSLIVHIGLFFMAGPRFLPGEPIKPVSTTVLIVLGAATWSLSLLVKTVRDRLLVIVGVLSFFAYFNFGKFHFGNYIHYWDVYHYYVGTKYFKELSYDRLYECSSLADSEDPSLRRRVELRKIMNLRTNVLGGTTEILAHPENCKSHFTPERWAMFKKDIEFFRNRQGVKRWEEAQTDHGYNATPVWNILGTIIANSGPATVNQMWAITLIDPLFIFGLAAMIWWAFGWQTLCVALAVFATNFPSRFYWTG